jgi:hypothetical protein
MSRYLPSLAPAPGCSGAQPEFQHPVFLKVGVLTPSISCTDARVNIVHELHPTKSMFWVFGGTGGIDLVPIHDGPGGNPVLT